MLIISSYISHCHLLLFAGTNGVDWELQGTSQLAAMHHRVQTLVSSVVLFPHHNKKSLKAGGQSSPASAASLYIYGCITTQ